MLYLGSFKSPCGEGAGLRESVRRAKKRSMKILFIVLKICFRNGSSKYD
jgi:hypothetical protein